MNLSNRTIIRETAREIRVNLSCVNDLPGTHLEVSLFHTALGTYRTTVTLCTINDGTMSYVLTNTSGIYPWGTTKVRYNSKTLHAKWQELGNHTEFREFLKNRISHYNLILTQDAIDYLAKWEETPNQIW